MEGDSGLGRLIYRPLDVSTRQIRLLELSQGTGNARVEGQLGVISVPLPNLIPDVLSDTADQLQRSRARKKDLELSNTRQITEMIQTLRNKWVSLKNEYESLKDRSGQTDEQSIAAVQDFESRIKELTERIKDNQKSRDGEVQVDRQSKPTAIHSNQAQTGVWNLTCSTEAITDTSKQPNTTHNLDPRQTEANNRQLVTVEYEAVSYCWNTDKSSTRILLNGLAFEAPSSAVEVLRNLRYSDRPRRLWIDALCINQEDHEERAHQVAMMGDIYRNSVTTLVWLGESENGSKTKTAIKLCNLVAQQILTGQELSELTDLDTVSLICQNISIPEEYAPALLDTIYLRRWFTRLWVWQETALSPTSVCHIGKCTVPWQDVMLTAFWWIEVASRYDRLPNGNLPSYTTEVNMHFPSTVLMIKIRSHSENISSGVSLSDLIQQSRRSTATDGRDKIYGLLGMTRWSMSGRALPPGIIPDYNKSKRNCIRDATRVMFEEDGNIDALCDDLLDIDRSPGSEYATWPSWTPIWCETSDIPGPLWLDIDYKTDNGRKIHIDEVAKCANPDVLTLFGYQFDVVESSTMIDDGYFAESQDMADDFRSLHMEIERFAAVPAKELLLTLLAERHQNDKVDNDNLTIQNWLGHFAEYSTGPSDSQTTKSDNTIRNVVDDQSLRELESIRDSLQKTSEGRRLFMTTWGHIGIGPAKMNNGDVAAVLFGGRWPFILRKQKDHYTLVGHAFIRGIMEGEFVTEMEARGVLHQRFNIH